MKAYKGLPMEGFIASWYAKNTRGDARGYRECARAVVDRLGPTGSVLEVGPGPGYLAVEIAKLGPYRITGLDISRSFVTMATENAKREGVSVDFRLGNASQMPLPDESFDFVVCRAAFKNFTQPVAALNEVYRVLKAGGQASIFDLRRNASLDDIDAQVSRMGLSRLDVLLTKATFRFVLLKNAYTKGELEELISRSRFQGCEILEEGIGFELRLSK